MTRGVVPMLGALVTHRAGQASTILSGIGSLFGGLF
jgi:hypothetical protein